MATAAAAKNETVDAGAETERPRPLKPRPLTKGFFQRMRRGAAHQERELHDDVEADPKTVDQLVEDSPYASETRQDFTKEMKEIASKSKDAKVLKFSPKYHTVNLQKEVELLKPPTAREAAYGGPPRYDWIDIVSFTMFLAPFGH